MLVTKLKHLDPKTNPFHDFRNFAYMIFVEVLKFGSPHEIQYDIMDWMVDLPVSPDGIRRGQIQAMRGCGKSVISCIYCCWLWYCNPTIRICLICANGTKAEESASLVKQIFDGCELLHHLRPDPQADVVLRHGKKSRTLAKEQNKMTRFDVRGAGVSKDPSFACYPLFGGWTGAHPDIIIPDDIEIPENSGTPGKRRKILKKVQECESLILEGGTIMYMGTPQTEESVYFELDNKGYAIRKWPAELVEPNDERAQYVSPMLLRKVIDGVDKPGSPSYPERFPAERLLEKRGKGLAYYALQMLLDPSYADANRFPLKLKDLIVFDAPSDCAPTNIFYGGYLKKIHDLHPWGLGEDFFCGPGHYEPQYEKYTDTVMYIDPKGGGADSVGVCIAATLNGFIYILECRGFAVGQAGGTSEALMERIARLGFQHGVKRYIVESNWGGSKTESAYAQLLQPILIKWNGQVAVELNYVTGQKEARILDTLEPIVGAHRLIVHTRVCKRQHDDDRRNIMYQFTHINRDRGALGHDDEIDALYGAVSQFISHVVLDPSKREAERHVAASIATAQQWDREMSKKKGNSWRTHRESQRLQKGRWRRV